MLVRPGELVYADFDGIVVVPREVEERALTLAGDKVGKETQSRNELLAGQTLRNI